MERQKPLARSITARAHRIVIRRHVPLRLFGELRLVDEILARERAEVLLRVTDRHLVASSSSSSESVSAETNHPSVRRMHPSMGRTDESTGTRGPRRDATQPTGHTPLSIYGTHPIFRIRLRVFEYSVCMHHHQKDIIGHMVFNSTRDSSYRGSRRQKRPSRCPDDPRIVGTVRKKSASRSGFRVDRVRVDRDGVGRSGRVDRDGWENETVCRTFFLKFFNLIQMNE